MQRNLRPQTARPKMQGNLRCPKDLLVSEGVVDVFASKRRPPILDKRPRSAHADISTKQESNTPVHQNLFDDFGNGGLLLPLRLDAVGKKTGRESAGSGEIWSFEQDSFLERNGLNAYDPRFKAAVTTHDVAIYPAARFHPIPTPPPPRFQDPNPRRRFVQNREDQPKQNDSNFVSRTTVLKELQPALSSISKLCLEPHLGKIAKCVQSIVMVYFDESTLILVINF